MSEKPQRELETLPPLGGVFTCDLRSLALFRIAVGIIIIADLLLRSSTIEAMYTDAGIISRDSLASFAADMEGTKDAMGWSLHNLSGSIEWQIALLVIAAIAALLLAAGWKTRVAAIVSWILLISIHARNPLILTSGDTLLKLLVFWCMFLPLSRIWSLDAKMSGDSARPKSVSYTSMATAGLILALFSMYFFTGISKCNSYWFDGIAMDYVLRLDIYSTGLGDWMLDYPWLLKLVCWTTVIGEVAVPLVIFIPWHNDRFRLFAMAFFLALHISIAVVMDVGLFGYISMIGWLALLPSSFWDSRFVQFVVPWASSQRTAGGDWVPVWTTGRKIVQVAAALLIVYCLCWNISNVQLASAKKFMPPPARFVGKWLNIKQGFVMFDIPPQHSPWFVYEAVLADGTQVDIFRGKPVDHKRPDSVKATIPSHHMRRLHRNMVRPQFARFRQGLAEYMVNHWNASHGPKQQVVSMKLTAYLDEIKPNYNGIDQIVQVWSKIGNQTDQALFDSLLEKIKTKGDLWQ